MQHQPVQLHPRFTLRLEKEILKEILTIFYYVYSRNFQVIPNLKILIFVFFSELFNVDTLCKKKLLKWVYSSYRYWVHPIWVFELLIRNLITHQLSFLLLSKIVCVYLKILPVAFHFKGRIVLGVFKDKKLSKIFKFWFLMPFATPNIGQSCDPYITFFFFFLVICWASN